MHQKASVSVSPDLRVFEPFCRNETGATLDPDRYKVIVTDRTRLRTLRNQSQDTPHLLELVQA